MILKRWLFAASLIGTSALFADLPTATQVQANMGMGYNIGNTMEVPGNPTGWGNIFPTQAYLDSIKAAGFNTVRIPCAWDSHASNSVINSGWLDSVQTVVDYAMKAGLYTILNIHWDGGWLQDDDFTSAKSNIVAKQKAYWTQIANRFVNYDEHLLFSGMNEPGLNLSWNSSLIPALVAYQQAFIDAVRATGGNNATRTLIVSGPKTDIDATSDYYTSMPTDNVAGRLMVEVHYYDPYQYTLMIEEQEWGASESILPQYYYGDYLSTTDIRRNAGYNAWAYAVDDSVASIKHANGQFAKMKRNFIDKGYPVIIGEFGANLHTDALSGSALTQHKNGRVQWHKDVATAAKNYGLTPILWDMGNESNVLDNMCYIRHSLTNASTAGKVVDLDVINAMRNVYGLGDYVNTGIASSSSTIRNDSSSSSSWQAQSSSSRSDNSSSSVTPSGATGSSSSVAAATLTKHGAGSSSQCVNLGAEIVSFYYTIANATGATVTGLPAGISGTLSGMDFTIAGTVLASNAVGNYAYTITTTGGSPNASKSGTITVSENCSGVIASTSSSSWQAQSSSSRSDSSSSSVALSEAKQSSSSEYYDYDNRTGIDVKNVMNQTLCLMDNVLSSEKDITLFDVNGNLIRQVRVTGASATLALSDMRQGVYIAKSGANVIRFRVK